MSRSSYIGMSTNNKAEYKALLAALEEAARLEADALRCYLDSELVVKQVQGLYKVKNQELKHLWQEVQNARKKFMEVHFLYVPRSHSILEKADELVNLTLDSRIK